MFGPIIAMLISAVGPFLVKLVLEWLTGALNKAATKVEARRMTLSKSSAAVAIVKQAIADTKPRQIAKRLILHSLLNEAATVANGGAISPAFAEAVGDAPKLAKAECMCDTPKKTAKAVKQTIAKKSFKKT